MLFLVVRNLDFDLWLFSSYLLSVTFQDKSGEAASEWTHQFLFCLIYVHLVAQSQGLSTAKKNRGTVLHSLKEGLQIIFEVLRRLA